MNNAYFHLEMKGRSGYIVYHEENRLLNIYVEVSGAPEYDLVAGYESFEFWSEPEKEPIDEKRRLEIIEKTKAWAESQRIRLDISPTIDDSEYLSRSEAEKGQMEWRYKKEGEKFKLVPEERQGILNRILRLFRM